MQEQKTIIVDAATQIHLNMPESLSVSALRAFLGATPRDVEVDALPVPRRPAWLVACIRLLRFYRRVRSKKVSHRCVYDPSCSRYSELAYREHGFIRGSILTVRRLQRCRPGNGGVDVP